ncbi:MAG: MFS transporter [Faecalibacillus faecis]
MATAYGTALGFESTSLLLALYLPKLSPFPSQFYLEDLQQNYNTSKLIVICILAYLGISIFAIFLTKQWQFWVLAILVGMFQGGIQSLSRSILQKSFLQKNRENILV